MDDAPHIAYLFSRFPAVPPALCDTEMLALEAAGFRLTVASLTVPADCFRLARPPALKAEVLYPPPPAVVDILRYTDPFDESWRGMAQLAARHAKSGAVSMVCGLERSAWFFARELRRRGVQQVHVRSAEALAAALYLKKGGLPFSFTAEDLPAAPAQAENEILLEAIGEAEFVVAPGESCRALLVSLFPDHASKILCIHQGIDASRYHAALCGDAGRLRIVRTRPLTQDRGLPVLMEAMASLRDREVDAELCIAGDGPWRAILQQEATRWFLNGRVTFCQPGGHEETKRLLAASDLFIHMDAESGTVLPPRIMEAMATGLPVIARAQPGVEELLADGVTGWLVPPDDAEALADRLTLLAEDPSLRSAAGHAGLERMLQEFSLRNTVRPLADQFRKSIAGRFAPAVGHQVAGVLCLMESWPFDTQDTVLAPELRWLGDQPGVELITADAQEQVAGRLPPESMEFLPDGAVLEAVWQQEPELAERAASYREECGGSRGEAFFRAARRAVYLAKLHRTRGWAHVHALRASTALWAWLLQRLTGIRASVTIEAGHGLPPRALGELISGFRFGSVSDSKIPGALPDLLCLLPPATPRRVLGLFNASPPKTPVADVPAVWERWLAQARGIQS